MRLIAHAQLWLASYLPVKDNFQQVGLDGHRFIRLLCKNNFSRSLLSEHVRINRSNTEFEMEISEYSEANFIGLSSNTRQWYQSNRKCLSRFSFLISLIRNSRGKLYDNTLDLVLRICTLRICVGLLTLLTLRCFANFCGVYTEWRNDCLSTERPCPCKSLRAPRLYSSCDVNGR